MIPISDFEDGKYLMFVTRTGTVKKTDLMSYSRIRSAGLRAIELAEDDELIRVKTVDDATHVIIGTHGGMAIRFAVSDVRPMGRTAHGVRGIKLSDGDYVIGASILRDNSELLVVTENGYGKKTALDEYKQQNRGGRGILTYKVTDKTGNVAGMKTVTDDDDLMMITSDGIVIRLDTAEISTYGRNTQGVRLMRLDDDVRVVSIARAEKDSQEEDSTDSENAEESEE
jgi:DNA gyrase subunit A